MDEGTLVFYWFPHLDRKCPGQGTLDICAKFMARQKVLLVTDPAYVGEHRNPEHEGTLVNCQI